MAQKDLNAVIKDMTAELSNVSMGSAATALAGFLNAEVRVSPAGMALVTADELKHAYTEKGVLARLVFQSGLSGGMLFFFRENEAAQLAALMMGSDPAEAGELSEIEMSALQEAVSMFFGSYTTALGGLVGQTLEIAPVEVEALSPSQEDPGRYGEGENWVDLSFQLEIDPDRRMSFVQLLPAALLKEMTAPMLESMGMGDISFIEEAEGEPPAEESPAEEPAAEEPAAEEERPGTEGPAPEPPSEGEAEEKEAEEAPTPEDSGEQEPKEAVSEQEKEGALFSEEPPSQRKVDDVFNRIERETVAEVGNISLGSSATALSNLLDRQVLITTPSLSLTTLTKLKEEFPLPSLVVSVFYTKGLEGDNVLVLKENDAALIAGLMMGMDAGQAPEELGEMEMSAISEAMNQMMGSASTAMSDFLGREIDITPPQIERRDLEKEKLVVDELEAEDPLLLISFKLEIEGLLQSHILQLMPISFAKDLTGFLLRDYAQEEAPPEAAIKKTPGQPSESQGVPAPRGPAGPLDLDEFQKDALAEVGNISLGAAATALSQLVDRKVQITAPRVTLTTMNRVRSSYPVPCLVVSVNYLEGLAGNNVLVIRQDDALVIAGLMLGMVPPERPDNLGELELSAISEAMNQMMGSSSTAMSDFFDRTIDISPPQLTKKDLQDESVELDELDEDTPFVQIAFRIEIEGLVDSELLQLVPYDFAKEVASELLSGFDGEETALSEAGAEAKEEAAPSAEKASPEKPAAAEAPPGAEKPSHPPMREEEYARLDLIRDIPVDIQVVLGKAKVPLKRVFSLVPGEVVDLERYMGEPVEIYANHRLVAFGEIVVVNGYFGVKVTSMVRSK